MADLKISQLTGATTPLAGTEVLPIVQSGATKKVAVSDLTAGRNVSAATLDITQLSSGDVLNLGSTNSGNGFGIRRQTNYLNCLDTDYISAYNIGGGNNDGMAQLIANSGRNGTPGTVKLAFGLDAPGGAAIAAAIGTASNHPFDIGVNSLGRFRFDTDGNLVPKAAAKGVNFTANTPAAGMTSQLLNWYEEGTWTPTDASGAGLTFSNVDAYYTRIGRMVYAYCRVTYPTTADTNAAAVGGLPFTIQNTQAARQANITYSSQTTATFLFPIPNNTYGIFFNAAGAVTNASMSGSDNWLMFTYPAA